MADLSSPTTADRHEAYLENGDLGRGAQEETRTDSRHLAQGLVGAQTANASAPARCNMGQVRFRFRFTHVKLLGRILDHLLVNSSRSVVPCAGLAHFSPRGTHVLLHRAPACWHARVRSGETTP
jgi:hypothetical protein